GIDASDRLLVSAKTGEGVPAVLEAIIRRIPPPAGDAQAPLQALIVDSWFDNYLGVVSLVRIVNGRLCRRDRIRVMSTGREHGADEIGIFTPHKTPRDALEVGEVGYVVAGIKAIDGAPVGDTLTHAHAPCAERLPGFKQVQPRVFAGIYTVSS